jgi:hypothetical protein
MALASHADEPLIKAFTKRTVALAFDMLQASVGIAVVSYAVTNGLAAGTDHWAVVPYN